MNMDIIGDQAQFMRACGQTVGERNESQCEMYELLLTEECSERAEAIEFADEVEEFDADLDILVVHIGRMLSRWHPNMIQAGWHEVMRSNMSKCVPDGNGNLVVQKRDDGKIMKGSGYSPPDLRSIMKRFGYEVDSTDSGV